MIGGTRPATLFGPGGLNHCQRVRPVTGSIADRLISNIYVADVQGQAVSAVTQFTGALTESPAWSPDGAFLAFTTNAGGGMGVWAFEVKGKNLRQVTHGENARHPTWLP